MKELSLYIDESGNLGKGNGKYFLICALEKTSESCYLIQWADIVANSLYKKYNSNNEIFYNRIKPYIIFESKFPSRTFGQ